MMTQRKCKISRAVFFFINQIIVEGVRGSLHLGDAALDQFHFINGSCQQGLQMTALVFSKSNDKKGTHISKTIISHTFPLEKITESIEHTSKSKACKNQTTKSTRKQRKKVCFASGRLNIRFLYASQDIIVRTEKPTALNCSLLTDIKNFALNSYVVHIKMNTVSTESHH